MFLDHLHAEPTFLAYLAREFTMSVGTVLLAVAAGRRQQEAAGTHELLSPSLWNLAGNVFGDSSLNFSGQT